MVGFKESRSEARSFRGLYCAIPIAFVNVFLDRVDVTSGFFRDGSQTQPFGLSEICSIILRGE
jgi:hypothetical protein